MSPRSAYFRFPRTCHACPLSAGQTHPFLVWKSGSSACKTDSSEVPSCTIGTLRRGARAQVTVVMQVALYLNPRVFGPVSRGHFPPGGFSGVVPQASITILQ